MDNEESKKHTKNPMTGIGQERQKPKCTNLNQIELHELETSKVNQSPIAGVKKLHKTTNTNPLMGNK